MGMLKEFKEFSMRGNVVDMAIGVIIGGAFGKIITSFVNDVLMPPLGLLMGGMNFSGLFINLSEVPVANLAEAKELNVPVIAYGQFINTVIDFLIIAFVIFLTIRYMNSIMPKKKPAPTRLCPYCKETLADDATRCPHCTAILDEKMA